MNNQNDIAEAIMLELRGTAITAEMLRSMIQEYLNSPEQTSGKITLGKLATEAGGNLDNIKITDKNIGDFTETARKYDVSFALKRDKSTEPPTWYVFFKQDKGSKDAMDRAFREFSAENLRETPIITRENIADIDMKMPHEKSEQPQVQSQEQEGDLPSPDELPEPQPPDME